MIGLGNGNARIRIGPWTVSPALNLLERDSRSVKIEPRAMDVLVFLAGQGGAVVSVEQLIAAVWKGAVVGDGSVYLAINQLRQALEESADGVRYIETIPKRGYRLTVPVEPSAARPADAAQPRAGSVAQVLAVGRGCRGGGGSRHRRRRVISRRRAPRR